MAKAKAICTCKTCGAVFERTAEKRNCTEANSWVAWAVEHFTECSPCYTKRMTALAEEKPVKATYYPDEMQQPRGIFMRLTGNTKPFKEELKNAGYRWQEGSPTNTISMLSLQKPRFYWEKHFRPNFCTDVGETFSELSAWIASEYSFLKRLTGDESFRCESGFSEFERNMFSCGIIAEAEAMTEADKLIANLCKPLEPQKPDCAPVGRWNGKVYGKGNKRKIYVDGEEQSVCGTVADALEKYGLRLAAYKKEVEAFNQQIEQIKLKCRLERSIAETA